MERREKFSSTERAEVAEAIRRFLYVDGKSPPNWNMGRCLSIMARLGRSASDLCMMCEGARIAAERGELKPWVEPGDPMTARVFSYRDQKGVPFANRCLHTTYKRRKRPLGTTKVKDVLREIIAGSDTVPADVPTGRRR